MDPNSRQERLLMRQRGAGRRNVNNEDFEISFGGFGAKRRSKTPSKRSRGESIAMNTTEGTRGIVSKDGELLEDDGPATTKKRKVESGRAVNVTPAPARFPSPKGTKTPGVPTLKRSGRRSSGRNNVIAIVEDQDGGHDEVLTREDGTAGEPSMTGSRASSTPAEIELENAKPGDVKKRRRKRRSIGQKSGRKRKRSSGNSLQEAALNIRPHNRRDLESPDGEFASEEEQELEIVEQQSVEEVDERTLSKTPASAKDRASFDDQAQKDDFGKKRRKRKSIARKPKNSRKSQELHTSTEHLQEEAGQDDDEDETYLDEEQSPEPPTPAAIRKKQRKHVAADRSIPSIEHEDRESVAGRGRSTLSQRKSKSKSTFPIITHRLAQIEALPTIDEAEQESETEDHFASNAASFPTRSAPNAVDVLAQICREQIAAAIEKVSVAGTSAKERKRKHSALEAFRQSLEDRLFDMSAALENRLTLEARVRKSKRDKAELQTRWFEVRKQREQVALECDAVRREHWESEETGKQAFELSEQLHELEVILSRGDDSEEEASTEYLFRTVKDHISSVDGGGLLNQVRDFNAQLERMATILEGRID